MAVRLIALYAPPDDPVAFDAHYRTTHAAIVRRYPGLVDLRLTRLDGVGDRPPAFYLMAEMAFGSRADLEAALASDAGVESGRDLHNFAAAGVTLLMADDESDL